LGISGFPGLIFRLRKLIILYNKFRKAAERIPRKTGQFRRVASVRLFCDASLDDDYVKGQFRKDQFATGEAMVEFPTAWIRKLSLNREIVFRVSS